MQLLFQDSIDVEAVIRDRDVSSIEQCIPIVVQFSLEGEHTQILDPNFVKMFRISQLSVEYLTFCKKYLDNTIVLLKKELAKLAEVCKPAAAFSL